MFREVGLITVVATAAQTLMTSTIAVSQLVTAALVMNAREVGLPGKLMLTASHRDAMKLFVVG